MFVFESVGVCDFVGVSYCVGAGDCVAVLEGVPVLVAVFGGCCCLRRGLCWGLGRG